MQLLWLNFLLVPTSIINKYPIIGNVDFKTVDMKIFLNTLLIINVLFISLLLPFSMFYYETQFDTKIGLKRSYTPYLLTLIVFTIIWSLIGGNYGAFREIIIDYVSDLTCNDLVKLGYVLPNECINNKIHTKGSFLLSILSLFLFIGYIYNVFFVGIGCVLVPLYLIFKLVNKPKQLSIEEYKNKISEILDISKARAMKGGKLKGKYDNCLKNKSENIFSSNYLLFMNEKRNIKNKIRKYEKEVISLSTYFENVETGYNNSGKNYIYLVMRSILLLFSILLSLSLFVVIVIKVIIDSNRLIDYSGNQIINLLFIIFSIIFPIYLSACVCFTWNILAKKILYCLPIHILIKSKTPLNSIIFNIGIVLFSSINIVYITSLSSSWLFKSDLHLLFLLASSTKLNYKLIPNNVLVYCLVGVSISTLIVYFASFIWDTGTKVNREVPKILTKYVKNSDI